MNDRPRPVTGAGSAIRLIAGLVFTMVAVGIAVIGFARLFGILEAGGYGTPAMRNALIVLGVAGAFLATGIATLIWDIAKRYESR